MKVAVPKETVPGERRVAIIPESVKKLVKCGLQVVVQSGAGLTAGFSDDDYRQAGALVELDQAAAISQAGFVCNVSGPRSDGLGASAIESMQRGSYWLGSLSPTVNVECVKRFASAGVTAFSTDQIPRITRAQAMDTLSSQATVTGYKGVLIAANESGRFFPLLMTAAGTVMAARVFVIGAGVAGLQAIATAKRLGAVVEATDTRPVVKEQVESVGGKFVGVDTSEQAQDAGGYAKELSKDFYDRQAKLISDRCAANDVVITTALIGGVKAPKLITEDMVKRMKPGSIIVDLAAEGGGNCTLTEPGKTVTKHGVILCGPLNVPATMPIHASTMYSRNLTAFIVAFCKDGAFQPDMDDEIIKGAMITHGGEVVHGPTRLVMQTG